MSKYNKGAALIEFGICLLPYILVLMGVMFFWHLQIGKQEAIKFSITASTLNEAQMTAFLQNIDRSSRNINGKFTAGELVIYDANTEGHFNSYANISSSDEPVYPYKEDGSDFIRATELSGNRVIYNRDTGEYRIGRSHKLGSRLGALGVLDRNDEGRVIDPTDDNVIYSAPEPAQQASLLLGDWIAYQSAGASYSYALPFGKTALPFEQKFSGSHSTWRSGKSSTVYSYEEHKRQRAIWPIIIDPFIREWSSQRNQDGYFNSVTGFRIGLIESGERFSDFDSTENKLLLNHSLSDITTLE